MKYTFFYILFSTSIFAHPVIYKGGMIFQGTFMPKMNEIRLGYTASPNYAFVYNSSHFENIESYQDHTLGMNFLIKRWLQKKSQGNIYGGVHWGQFSDNRSSGDVGHLFFMADWETREHYTMLSGKSFMYNDENRHMLTARYGFAPFVAGMNELQAWMIFQAMYVKEQSRELIVTPMIRFFYRNVLWEIGSSTRGQTYLTLMVHY